ncbi:MAG: GNAT family N-acetyltransferase [Abditibacteriota bacterium]|nr:GNAT family N-acetyltransferase [Abditibacteriota bacterium]
MIIRPYRPGDLPRMAQIWNEIVEEGIAFPQEELLDPDGARNFFAEQSHTGVAEEGGEIWGLYILHPNNVGRCGHICNASYAVDSRMRGRHIGEALVKDCLSVAKGLGFRVLQFNAVVATNLPARRLYERLGFVGLGVIPGGFRLKDGSYADICPYYKTLQEMTV